MPTKDPEKRRRALENWKAGQKALHRSQLNIWVDKEERELVRQAVARHRAGEAFASQPDADRLEAAERRIATLEDELRDERRAHETAAGKLADRDREIDRLKGELAETEQRLSAAEQPLEPVEDGGEAAGSSGDGLHGFRDRTGELEAELVKERERNAELRKAIQELRRRVVPQLGNEIADLDVRRVTAQAVAAVGAILTAVLAGAWLWTGHVMQSEIDSAQTQAAAAIEAGDAQARKIEELKATIATRTNKLDGARTNIEQLTRSRDAAVQETAQVRESVAALYDAFAQGCARIPLWQQEMVDHCEAAARLHAQGR